MMKRIFNILTPVCAGALMVLASCSNEVEVWNSALTQQLITYSTSGTRVTDNSFDEGDKIVVWGNHSVGDGNEFAPYISEQYVTLQDGAWNVNKEYFWPAVGTMDFYATYPCPDALQRNKLEIVEGVNPTLKYTINDFNESIDLLAAHTTAVSCPSDSPVPLHFGHVLNKLQINVIDSCEIGVGVDIKIKSIEVTSTLYSCGTLNWETMSMEPVGEKEDVTYTADEMHIAYAASCPIATLYCIPGVIGRIKVNVQWVTINGGVEVDPDTPYSINKDLEFDEPLEAGKVKSVYLVFRRNKNSASGGDVTIGQLKETETAKF